MAAVSAAAWLVLHLLIAGGVAVLIGAAFYGGKRHERRKTPRQPVQSAAPPAAGWQSTPAPDPRSDQIAYLEQLAARPLSAIIASYETVQHRYAGRSQL
jgi:predicted membrane channel-forming protein YqfA (hemolysin III family)